MDAKICRLCKVEKPLADFHRHKSHKDGHHSACKPCALAEQNRSRLKEPERLQPYHPEMKQCAECKEVKTKKDFPRNKNYWDGYNHICKTCNYARRKAYGEIDEVREKLNEAQKRRYWDDPERARDYHASGRYGVRRGTYAALLTAQNGKCAICERPSNHGNWRFAMDHDAVTGTIRGLLCTWCNQALGQLQHSPELLRKAASYLENPPAPQFLASLPREA